MQWNILNIIGFILGLLGAALTIWSFRDKFFPFRKLTWKFAETQAKKIAEDLTAHNFCPTLIVGIGRGGAILGAFISGCLGHRPLIVIDRKYNWKKGDRFDDIIFDLNVPKNFLKCVLLVAGEVHSGNTIKMYEAYFRKKGTKNIKRVALFYEKGAKARIDYIGLESKKKNIKMPWMFSRQYLREDQTPSENCLGNDAEKKP